MLNKSPRDHSSKDDTAVPPEERKFKKKNSMKMGFSFRKRKATM